MQLWLVDVLDKNQESRDEGNGRTRVDRDSSPELQEVHGMKQKVTDHHMDSVVRRTWRMPVCKPLHRDKPKRGEEKGDRPEGSESGLRWFFFFDVSECDGPRLGRLAVMREGQRCRGRF